MYIISLVTTNGGDNLSVSGLKAKLIVLMPAITSTAGVTLGLVSSFPSPTCGIHYANTVVSTNYHVLFPIRQQQTIIVRLNQCQYQQGELI
jgi:hypothetical protein